MSFVSPYLLGALLPLVGLPLLIHLFNRGFPRRLRFSSIDRIKETLARRSRLQRWRHWILLLLRTLVLALLLLAFLRPVWLQFGLDPQSRGRRQVLIVLDHSLSMEHRGEGPTPRERAQREATQLLDTLEPRDTVNVVLLQQPPTACFPEFSRDHGQARRFLAALSPGLTAGNLTETHALVARLLGESPLPTEVFYLSDFQRKNWGDANFDGLPEGTRLFFVDVGSAHRGNRALLNARVRQGQLLAGDTVELEVTVGNFDDAPFNDRVTAVLDNGTSHDREITLAPWSVGQVELELPGGGPGLHSCELRIAADGLSADNRFYLTFPIREREEVLIVSDADGPRTGAFYLGMALNPFGEGRGSLWPIHLSSRELSANRLAGVRNVFFTGVDRLDDGLGPVLGRFLFDGGGLIYFLDGSADAQNLALLERSIGAGPLPLHLTQRRTATNLVSGAQQIVRGDFRSRFLRLFRGAARQDLGLLTIYDYYQAGATGTGDILLAYADLSPAMAAWHHGLGTLLLLNFSADERAGNLPRQRIFPAWIQDLVKSVAPDEMPPVAHVVGETLNTEVWRIELQTGDFVSPSGKPILTQRERDGERVRVSFVPGETGFYQMGKPSPRYLFGVNPSPDESDLRPLDKALLPTEFAAGHPAFYLAGRGDFEALARGQPAFQWFLLAGLAVLMVESGFQWWLVRRPV